MPEERRTAKDCPPGKEFVFKLRNGQAVGKAKNLDEFVQLVKTLPLEALVYHAQGGHFGPWLELLGEQKIVKKLQATNLNTPTVRVTLLRCLRS